MFVRVVPTGRSWVVEVVGPVSWFDRSIDISEERSLVVRVLVSVPTLCGIGWCLVVRSLVSGESSGVVGFG